MSNLRDDLREVINRHSAEQGSNTPDHVLASFLLGSLNAFDAAVRARDDWHDFKPSLASSTGLSSGVDDATVVTLPVEVPSAEPDELPQWARQGYGWTACGFLRVRGEDGDWSYLDSVTWTRGDHAAATLEDELAAASDDQTGIVHSEPPTGLALYEPLPADFTPVPAP